MVCLNTSDVAVGTLLTKNPSLPRPATRRARQGCAGLLVSNGVWRHWLEEGQRWCERVRPLKGSSGEPPYSIRQSLCTFWQGKDAAVLACHPLHLNHLRVIHFVVGGQECTV